MPEFIAKVHDSLIIGFLNRGKSQLFTQGTTIFIKCREGFIECCRLKVDNFFENIDDYILTGSLIRIKQSSNFILFDKVGRILGITKEIFQHIKSKSGQDNLMQFLEHTYIYLLFPQLFSLLDKSKSQMNDVKNEEFIEEHKLIMTIPRNYVQIMNSFNQYKLDMKSQFKAEASNSSQFKRFDSVYSRLSSRQNSRKNDEWNQINDNMAKIQGIFINLFDQHFREQI